MLEEGIKYSVQGPLHKALQFFDEVLCSYPNSKKAAVHLADVYTRLGRYEDALTVLRSLRRGDSWDSGLQLQWDRTERINRDLQDLEANRYCKAGFLSKAVVPDGKGGYIVDSLGFPGSWEFRARVNTYVPPGACLRLLKSLAATHEHIRSGAIQPSGLMDVPRLQPAGFVVIHPDLADAPMRLSLLEGPDKALKWRLDATYEVVSWEREKQRESLRRLVEQGPISSAPDRDEAEAVESEDASSAALPRVLVLSLGLASDYGVTILRDRLQQRGFEAAAAYVRSINYMEDYLETFAALDEFSGQSPHVFAVSVLDAVIEEACYVISHLRRRFSEAQIVIGGSSSQTPEQCAALVPDFDVLIKGDADEALPLVAEALGRSPRGAGLSRSQVNAIKALPGGVIIQRGNTRIVHHLDHTLVPKKYHLPIPDKRKTIYYWQTSRGCPYDCRFCNKWSGKRYRMALPWNNDPVELPDAKRSALAMIEFLLLRLAMEWPEGITQEALTALLKESKAAADNARIPKPDDKIMIVIEDDDFLINRDRVKAFSMMVDELGLQRFYTFSAITSVRTLYRGSETVDLEVLSWLKTANFQSLDVGSDGLSQSTIDENQKGYTLDSHVIPLNRIAKRMGFFCFNNTIITTPYTTIPQLIESLIFYVVCPYPINVAIEIGIMGHIGNKYTNEDIANQQYDWRNEEGLDRGHFGMLDNYRVPKGYPEYALNASQIISYADPKVRDLIVEFPNHDPFEFLRSYFSERDVRAVVEAWTRLPESRPEMKALGESIFLLLDRNQDWDCSRAFATVREEMSALNLMSFVDYHHRLEEDAVQEDPSFQRIAGELSEAERLRSLHDYQAAEHTFKNLIRAFP
ncbi:MAG: tetratricopeptide repeat protein [Deltaproteobacteria bacterium]|nr:tetratricopeptide repeat protein [Deltaproteobacteria bacterium]